MKTILMLTDFSETANHAVSYLSSIAGQLGIERILIYHSCTNLHPDMVMVTDVLVTMPSGEYELYKEAMVELNKIKTELKEKLGAEIIIEGLADKRPILKAVEEITAIQKIDLVVLGICGSGYTGVNSVGHLPASLMKRHEFSLLIIPSLAAITSVKSIMLACELKDIVNRLPDVKLKSVVNSFHALLHIVNVDREEAKGAMDLIPEQETLHQLLDEIKPEFHYLENKDVIGGLLEFSDQHQIDMIVAVPKKRGFLESLFHESATKKLAVNATKPLLILHKNN